MTLVSDLFKFIKSCPTALHTADTVKNILLENGFTELCECEISAELAEGKYFVIRGGSSVIAFKKGNSVSGFNVVASHGDTPAFKVTGIEEKCGFYATVPVEKYGGSILYSWIDRPLSIAGRVVVRSESGLSVRLLSPDLDLFSIPGIAIHQNRAVNDGYKFNPAVDMLPLLSLSKEGGALSGFVAECLGVNKEDIVSSDLYVYNREEPRLFGLKSEFILSPRLDNLLSVFLSLRAFLSADGKNEVVSVFAAFDNEEVGNSTKQGANSTFLSSVVRGLCKDDSDLARAIEGSFMISLDNAHGVHPNHPELSNPAAAPLLGGGIAVKYHANQFYTTDAVSDAVIRTIAKNADAPIQSFATRADMLSGSTLGSVATTRLPIPSVDLGIPQLSMHSSTETCALSDVESSERLLEKFYSSKISRKGSEIVIE